MKKTILILLLMIGVFWSSEVKNTGEDAMEKVVEEDYFLGILSENQEVLLEESPSMVEQWMEQFGIQDKKSFSFLVMAVGIFWFIGHYVKWIKKAFQVKSQPEDRMKKDTGD